MLPDCFTTLGILILAITFPDYIPEDLSSKKYESAA